MKMKNKIVSLAACCSLLFTALAGCSSASSSASTAASTGASSTPASTSVAEVDPTTISGEFTYWTYTDSANNLITEFNKVYPNIKVNLQVFGGDEYKTKILTTIQDGKGIPDLFDLEENYAYEFLDSDVIEDLSARGYEDIMKDFYPYMVAGAKDSSGVVKGVNFQSSPVGFWYLRDAAKKWLGTDNPDEIAAMMTSWDDIKTLAEKVKTESNGSVWLWPNIVEMVKVVGFSFQPLVRNGNLEVTDEWTGLIDDMRSFHDSGLVADLGSWSSEWAAKWNSGELLFRVMPSWDFFTDWEKNSGNVGIAKPFENAFEGATLICMYSGSDKKDITDLFLKFVCSDDFQKANMDNYNQVPASAAVAQELAVDFSAEKFGGQNLMETYHAINSGIAAITPDKYTRSVQNIFQKHAAEGIKNGLSNDKIIANFKAEVKDKYPELTGTS